MTRYLPKALIITPHRLPDPMHGCCEAGWTGRRYYTRDERRQWLEGYAQQLERELAGVRERIEALA